jgi:transposase
VEKQSLEVLLGLGLSVEEIGKRFRKDPSTVSYWLQRHGLTPARGDEQPTRSGIPRDRLEDLVERGMTIAEIAAEVGRSKSTVRLWLARYGFRTKNKVGPRHTGASVEGRSTGRREIVMSCIHHGETAFVLEGRGYYRCKRCRADRVAARRRKAKATLVQEAGGRCVICGYDRHPAALEFHHLDRSQKRLTLSRNGAALSLDAMRAEAAKCVLLCSNCHAEVEAGVTTIPARVRDGPSAGKVDPRRWSQANTP